MKQGFVLLFLSLSCLADGNRVGNGGNVVICPDRSELLDFYESPLSLQKFSGADHAEILRAALARLQKINPRLTKQYQQRSEQVLASLDARKGISLTDVKDSKHLFKPTDQSCRIQQVATRKALSPQGEPRFVIDQDSWERLSPTHQAGLIVHEVVYEHLFKLGEGDSIKARQLTALIFSEELSSEKFWKTIKDLKIPIYR